jgi:hypothetical protein
METQVQRIGFLTTTLAIEVYMTQCHSKAQSKVWNGYDSQKPLLGRGVVAKCPMSLLPRGKPSDIFTFGWNMAFYPCFTASLATGKEYFGYCFGWEGTV